MNSKAFFLAPLTLIIGLLWFPVFFEKSFSGERELIEFQNSFDSAVLLKAAIETDISQIVNSELEKNFLENNAVKIKQGVNKKLFLYLLERQKISSTPFWFFSPVSGKKVMSLTALNEMSSVAILRPEKKVKVVEYYFHGKKLEWMFGTEIFFHHSSKIFAGVKPGFTVRKVFFFE